MKLNSLRSRLIVIILSPLLLIAGLTAIWQYQNTTDRAEDIFDRGLLSAALAISKDVAIFDGDALTPRTRQLISDTSGGEIFYHVYAPDGVFVTGYSTPPVAPGQPVTTEDGPAYFFARYQNREVRALKFPDITSVSGVSGTFNITVWQDMAVRNVFVTEVLLRSFGAIAILILSVAMVVWFGVRLGLRPLLDLEQAIAIRTPNDLEPIRRKVPSEAKGIVETLNLLLDRVSRRISSKDEFIANAAHQLRNPVAGALALSEAANRSPTFETAKQRTAELTEAIADVARLTDQLLSFERAGGFDLFSTNETFDLVAVGQEAMSAAKAHVDTGTVKLAMSAPSEEVRVRGDAFLLTEALINLLTNALVHGGPELSEVQIEIAATATEAKVSIKDDGVGIAPEDQALALNRFGQLRSGQGSGLGLPIAKRTVEAHGGQLNVMDAQHGTGISISLPMCPATGALEGVVTSTR